MKNTSESFDQSHTIALGGTGPGASRRVLKVGDVIGGAYKLKSLLGKGGMGYVFCAEHITIKRDYALKMLAPELLNEESRRRFEIEGRAIANLDHPNIIKVYDMGLDAGNCPFYVMDLLDGTALSDCIDMKQALAFEECLDIFRRIASGLGYAHSKGIVHRDVKPSNIMLLSDSSGRPLVKIVDFGIAKLLPSASLSHQSHTATGAVFGSPLYMSPEQCLGIAVDHRSDIYSLGCTLFETLCGKPPFVGQSALETVMMHQDDSIPSILQTRAGKNLPQSVDLLLRKMLAKRPEDRYQSMEQVRHDLGRVKQGKAIGKLLDPGPASGIAAAFQVPDPSLARTHQLNAKAGSLNDGRLGDKQRAVLLTVCALTVLVVGGLLRNWLTRSFPFSGGQISPAVQNFPPEQTRSGGKDELAKKKIGAQVEAADSDILGAQINVDAPSSAPDPEMLKARHIFDKCGRIKSTDVTIDGATKRRLIFPDWPIGKIVGEGFGPVLASGVVYAPADKHLRLDIGAGQSTQVLQCPEIVEKIDPGEFYGLGVGGKNIIGFRAMLAGLPAQTDPLQKILKAACLWSKLELVTLHALPVSSAEFDLLNDFKHLRYFDLRDCRYSSADLARQPFLRRLKVLSLQNNDGIQLVCDKLSSSQNLQEAQFIDCKTSPGALLKLRTCPQLHRLELHEANFDLLVPAVTRLTKLHDVQFAGAPLNPVQIKMITACPNIRHLILPRAAMSPEALRYCAYYERKVSYSDAE